MNCQMCGNSINKLFIQYSSYSMRRKCLNVFVSFIFCINTSFKLCRSLCISFALSLKRFDSLHCMVCNDSNEFRWNRSLSFLLAPLYIYFQQFVRVYITQKCARDAIWSGGWKRRKNGQKHIVCANEKSEKQRTEMCRFLFYRMW